MKSSQWDFYLIQYVSQSARSGDDKVIEARNLGVQSSLNKPKANDASHSAKRLPTLIQHDDQVPHRKDAYPCNQCMQ